MKKKISLVLTVSMLAGYGFTVYGADTIPNTGEVINGFTVTDVRDFEIIGEKLITFEHNKTGGKIIYIDSDDINCAFNISFMTPPQDDTGLTHVFEHSALSGSEKYPSKTLTFALSNQSYITYLNATTSVTNTNYMISSLSDEQLYNLADYYLSGVFDTLIYTDPSIKEREAWHYELEKPDGELTISGTVYSEMQGNSSIINSSLLNTRKSFYAGSPMQYNSGGDPDYIPNLTNEDMIEYHKKYYTPSNCITTLYGDMDYEKYLALFDSYFSKYDKQTIEIDTSIDESTPDYIEETYYYPVSKDTDISNQSVICYALEADNMDVKDFVSLSVLVSVINSLVLPDMTAQSLPNASISCSMNIGNEGKPALIFMAVNVDPEDKDTVKTIVTDALRETTSLDKDIAETISEQTRLSVAMATETKNLGVSITSSAASLAGMTGDPYFYYTLQDESLDESNYDFEGISERFLNGRSAVITTVPQAGLLEEKQDAQREKLAAIKQSMTDDEINNILEDTAAYKATSQAGVSEDDKKYIEQINTITVDDLTAMPEEYKINDYVENGVRYVSVEANKPEVGQGRIMFDVSDFSVDEINYLNLYNMLAGSLDTTEHSYNDLGIYVSRYANIGTDIMTLKSDTGFTPYFILKWTGFSEYSDELYDIADEILFNTKFDDIERIKYVISQSVNSYEIGFEQASPYELMFTRAMAMYDTEQAYNYNIESLEYLSFLRDTLEKLDTDPQSVISSLKSVKSKLHNKDGAAILYAGTAESIEKNKAAAEKFFEDIPLSEKTAQDFSSLKIEKANEALELNSNVNYNGLYMPYDDFNGKVNVLSGLLYDSYCIPNLRNKHNIYSILTSLNEDGICMITYRDPEIKSTYDEYSKIGSYLRNGDITQDMVDNYIKSSYSQFISPAGVLSDAYWYADSYMDGKPLDFREKRIEEIKATTVEDIRGYADIFDKWYNEGVKFTAAGSEAIESSDGLFDKILHVRETPDTITIIINGQTLKTPVAPYIENDITMVPMRAIFEELGAEVEWIESERLVKAYKDGITLEIPIGSNDITRISEDGTSITVTSENTSAIVNDFTVIPVRAVSEMFGCDVQWDEDAKTVIINY